MESKVCAEQNRIRKFYTDNIFGKKQVTGGMNVNLKEVAMIYMWEKIPERMIFDGKEVTANMIHTREKNRDHWWE